jgi:diguanylate cyclase (GGDEF)-like protein
LPDSEATAKHRVGQQAEFMKTTASHSPFLCARCTGARAPGDTLTGLADRALFADRLAAMLGRPRGRSRRRPAAAEQPGSLAVLLIDLDRFKAVNDTLGHAAGDALLRAVGGRLRAALRKEDIAARLGGDEFAVLLAPPATTESTSAIAERLAELLARPYLVDGGVATVGASIGAALLVPGEEGESDLLLRRADLAMYQAKNDGRGRFRLFEPAMQERAEARRKLEADLRAALALGQFELHYQPQINLATHRLTGFEALIRWRHPLRGMVPADSFIALAEELHLLPTIGEWVVRTACGDAVGWPGSPTVGVNVAAQQFENGWLVPSVAAALQASGLQAARLELEVTETALLRNGSVAIEQLVALKALGVKISLDDFGTGYSSLTQLRSFAFDRVKIDRSFAGDPAVARAVAALGTSLGMRTTAEGVETAEQLNRLRAEGCTEAQGFLLSHPVPAADVVGVIDHFAIDGDAMGAPRSLHQASGIKKRERVS